MHMRRTTGDEETGAREPLLDAPAATTESMTLHTNLGQHVGATLKSDTLLQAVLIQHLHPNDLGARAGLRPGDVIVALNDVPVSSHKDAARIMDAATANQEPLNVTFMRASHADRERSRLGSGSDHTLAQKRKWLALNIVMLLFIFWWSQPRNDNDFATTMTHAELQKLQKLALHDARDKMSEQLTELAGNAQWLAAESSHEILDHLETRHPGALVHMLRATMFLNGMFNATKADRLADLASNATASVVGE